MLVLADICGDVRLSRETFAGPFRNPKNSGISGIFTPERHRQHTGDDAQ